MCENSIAWIVINWAGAALAAIGLALCSVWAIRVMSEWWFWIRYRSQLRKAREQTANEAAWLVGEPPQGVLILAKVHNWGVSLGVVEGARFKASAFTCPAENVLGWIRVPGERAKKADHSDT